MKIKRTSPCRSEPVNYAPFIRALEGRGRSKRSEVLSNSDLAARLRQRMSKALAGRYKTGSAVSDLGCSMEEFRNFISGQFKPGMTWENYGQWELDHCKPLSLFDLSVKSEFLEAANYKNYQPLWATENRVKGAIYTAT